MVSRRDLLPSLRPFRFTVLLSLPEVAYAVYVFWSMSKGKAVYVGKSENGVRQRLMQHFQDSHNPVLRMWIKFNPADLQVGYTPAKRVCVRELERCLIRALDPVANNTNKR